MRAVIFACFTLISLSAPLTNAAEPYFPRAHIAKHNPENIQIALSREQRITRAREKRATAERRRADAASNTERFRKQMEEIAQEVTFLTAKKQNAQLEAQAVGKELRKTRDLRVREMTVEYRQALNEIRDRYIGKPGPMGREARNRKKLLNMNITKANHVVIEGIQGHQAKVTNLGQMLEKKRQERAHVQKQLDEHARQVKKIDKEISKIDRKLRRLGAQNATS